MPIALYAKIIQYIDSGKFLLVFWKIFKSILSIRLVTMKTTHSNVIETGTLFGK